MPTITTPGDPSPRDYYAEALALAQDFAPARAAQLQSLILVLIEHGIAADDGRAERLLAPLFGAPSALPGLARSDRTGVPGGLDPSAPIVVAVPYPGWLALADRVAQAILALILLGVSLLWFVPGSEPIIGPTILPTIAPTPVETGSTTNPDLAKIFQYLLSWPALGVVAGIVLIACIWPVLVGWWRRHRQRQLRRDPLPDRAPLAKLATGIARARLFAAPGLSEAIRRLRRYRAIPSLRLDVRRTLRATIAQAGAPAIRYARRRLSPDFVLLSERLQPHDHLPEFAEAWKGRLVDAGIGCEHYEFWGDPNTLLRVSDTGGRRDERAVRQSLDAVLARHDGGNVVVMLESFVALDATASPHWLARTRQVATPYLMNPRDYPYWTNEEARLADLGLPGFAATVAGTMALAERTDRAIDDPDGVPARAATPGQADLSAFLFSHRAMTLASDPPSAAQIATIVDTLERWLERGAFDWLRALAVLPMVNPGFTCFVGATLRDESLVTHDRYLALSRLPWLRSARMPDWLRLALLETLSAEALQRAAAVAAAYLSPARQGLEREEQLVELRRTAERPANRRKVAERLAAGGTPGLTDKLLIEVLNGRPPHQLGVAYRGEIQVERPDWRRDPRVHAAVCAALAALAVFAFQPRSWQEAGGRIAIASSVDPNAQPTAAPPDAPSDAPSDTFTMDASDAAISPIVNAAAPTEAPTDTITMDASDAAIDSATAAIADAAASADAADAAAAAADAAAFNQGRWSILINAGNVTDITAFAQIGVVTWNTYFSERERQTPLQQVAERCNGPAIRLFLAHGNDPDVKNIYGDSARTIARVRCPPGSEANAILNPVVGLFIVYFDWDKTDITPEAASVLDNVVSQFKRRGNVRINLAAYTDTTRSAAYAMGLSEREAASVTAYLTSHGIPAEAISSQAFGNTNLRVQTADGVREQQNRRVEITFGGAKAD